MEPQVQSSADCRKLGGAGGDSANTSQEKKRRRLDILEKKKSVDRLIKSAYADNYNLASFPSFQQYTRDGLSVYLQLGHGNRLSASLKQYIQNLLKMNMEGPFGTEWPEEEKVKRREMVNPEALYIFVHERLDSSANGMSPMLDNNTDIEKTSRHNGSISIVGFVHYRFVVEEEIPVLYVYELQLDPRVQGKGLGKFLMQLIELIAQKKQMGAVVLTVQKANSSAMNFYTNKLGYVVSTMSPSRVEDPLLETKKSYEILCKAFDPEARALLEVNLFPELALKSSNAMLGNHN